MKIHNKPLPRKVKIENDGTPKQETRDRSFFNHLPEMDLSEIELKISDNKKTNELASEGRRLSCETKRSSIIKQIIPKRGQQKAKNDFESIPNLKKLLKFENVNVVIIREQIRPEIEFFDYKAHKEYTIESEWVNNDEGQFSLEKTETQKEETTQYFSAGEFSEYYRRKLCGSLADITGFQLMFV